MMFWFVLSLKSLISAISQSSVSPGLVAPNRDCGNLLMHGTHGMALYVRKGFQSFRQRKLECSCHESCVFRICSKINNFYVYAFHRKPGHDGSLYDYLLDSKGDANAHHSEWLESVSPTDRHGRDVLDFEICQVASSWFAVPLTLLVTDAILR